MNIPHYFKIFLVYFIFAFGLPTWAVRDLSDLAKGRPKLQMQGQLPAEQYVEVETHRLAKGKVAWVNWALLEELGYDIKSGTKAKRTQKILEAVGWVANDAYVRDGEVTAEKKIFLADFYGGGGLGPNLGSARAASAGDIQIKGIGITPMLNLYDQKHTARSSTHEAIKDAVWGEIFNNEVPYGGNRLVAIIDRGELDKNGESQMLEIRLDPVRMGHFIKREYNPNAEDLLRSKHSADLLPNALPQPEGASEYADNGEKLYQGLHEFSKRIAIQFSHSYMKRIFHGAVTQSNIEINGRMIDFGTASANPNFGAIKYLDWKKPFGYEDVEVKYYLIKEFINKLVLSDSLKQSLIVAGNNHGHHWNQYNFEPELIASMTNLFTETYDSEAKKVALELTGVPAEIVKLLLQRHGDLASDLFQLTKAENKISPIVNLQVAKSLLNQEISAPELIFKDINQLGHWSEGNILAIINKHLHISLLKNINGDGDASVLAKRILIFLQESAIEAKKQNVDKKDFKTLMRANFEFRNKSMDALFLPELRKRTAEINESYIGGKSDLIGKTITDLVSQSLRTIRGLKWYEAPVRVRNVDGKTVVEIYNAKEGKTTEQIYRPQDSQMQLNKKIKFGRCEMLFAS